MWWMCVLISSESRQGSVKYLPSFWFTIFRGVANYTDLSLKLYQEIAVN